VSRQAQEKDDVPLVSDLGVGKRIRQVRRRLNLTQLEFGKRLGVIKVSVARYEAGRIPRANLLDRIASLGGVSVEWLLHGGSAATEGTQPSAVGTGTEDRGFGSLSDRETALNQTAHLPSRYQERYSARVKELTGRMLRELEEYAQLLEAEYRGGKRKRRRPS